MALNFEHLVHHPACTRHVPWEAAASFTLLEAASITAGYAPCCDHLFGESPGRDPAVSETINTYMFVIQRAVYAGLLPLSRSVEVDGNLDASRSYITKQTLEKWHETEELPLSPAERRSLLTLIRGIAHVAYPEFRPGKRIPVGEVRSDIERTGIRLLDDDTISKWMREALKIPLRDIDQ